MEFKYIAVLVGLVLLVFLLYKEIRRANRARLMWRILVNIIAVSCFVLLIVPIRYETHLKQNPDEIILFTDGTNPDSVSKLKGKKYALPSVDLKNEKAAILSDLSYFLKSNPNIRKLAIYGYGLNAPELEQLKGYQINFHPSPNPNGIIAANWPAKLKTTELLQVQGTYQNSGDESVKLFLKGLGKTVDSTVIEAKSNKAFSFKTAPKQTGKAVYELISLQKKDTLAKDPVPVQVGDQAPMKVLILASFPDFEYKFLKNWLYENQYPLAFRSQISKNKYAFNFLNLDSVNLNQINTSSLKKFDIMIIDEEELSAISPGEKSSINMAVNNGMGLLIKVAGSKALTTLSGKSNRYEVPLKGKTLNLILAEDHFKFNPLPLEQALFLKTKQNEQSVIIEASGKTIVNSTINGYGKILVSTLSSTYNWLLSGQKNDYATYWSKLLANTARKRHDIQSVNIIPQFPVVNQKTRIIADLATSDKVPTLKIDSFLLSPRQNMELPFQWDAFYWPKKSGWTNLQVNQTIESIYIYGKADWQALKNQEKLDGTHQFIKKLNTTEAKNKLADIVLEKEVSLWWFFAGFLLAAAFLWYEARILAVK
ncbi:hypothetical protein [Pedobacter alluvionis]|uniref:VWA domain-containing protein n=1 Tax=Pedobacter alluvionis TaxID=475253 RepID=A0A497YA44_9SPHI|nr:hypothetical protein [Pedobacter alluvionis]RLJ80085.1 hypothetical protein BCL90_0821 [Pedobacter alluvionis]TFB31378.1 hypothetical protein E3V97_12310 [Pedobacter alluvionis]